MTMPDHNGLAPIRVDVSPGRRVLHIIKAHHHGVPVEIHTPYRIVSVAWDTRTYSERVILAAEDGKDAGGLYLFGLAELAEHFVDALPPAPRDGETVKVIPEKIAGVYTAGTGV